MSTPESYHNSVFPAPGRLDPLGTLILILLDAIQHAHDRDGQVPRPLRPPKTQAGQGEILDIRQYRREGLQDQVVPGTVWNQGLCTQCGDAFELEVSPKFRLDRQSGS
jgi:hypothetical protein